MIRSSLLQFQFHCFAVALWLAGWSAWGGEFRLYEQMSPGPEGDFRRVVALQVDTNRFFLASPPGWRIHGVAAELKAIVTTPDQAGTIVLQLFPSVMERTNNLPDAKVWQGTIASRHPGAEIAEPEPGLVGIQPALVWSVRQPVPGGNFLLTSAYVAAYPGGWMLVEATCTQASLTKHGSYFNLFVRTLLITTDSPRLAEAP